MDALQPKIQGLVTPYLAATGNLPLVVGVLRGDEQQAFGFGELTKGAGDGPDENTVFEIGSITKVFTANLLADLVREGRVRLDDPVRTYLPESVRVPTFAGREITLFHLTTHTSSLPRLPSNLWKTVKDMGNPYANYREEDLYEFLTHYHVWRPIGTTPRYSNLGAGLLGHALARACGQGYEEAVAAHVARPLGLTDTSVTLSPDQQSRLAVGHNKKGEPVPNWDLPSLAGAGALRSTVRDMLRYLRANLGGAEGPAKEMLETCQELYPLRRAPLWQQYGSALGLTAAGLLAQWHWGIHPGSWKFALAVMLGPVVGAWVGGWVPGLAALALSVAGTWNLWGQDFGYVRATLVGLFFLYFLAGRRPAAVRLGWQSGELKSGEPLVWHNGGTGGYRSFIGFCPNTRTAVAVLSASERDVDDIGVGVMNALQQAI